jgi:hypothetical protein
MLLSGLDAILNRIVHCDQGSGPDQQRNRDYDRSGNTQRAHRISCFSHFLLLPFVQESESIPSLLRTGPLFLCDQERRIAMPDRFQQLRLSLIHI